MSLWTDRRILDLLQIEQPILLAPMAGSGGSALAAAVALGGGLGAIPCASISVDAVRKEVGAFRSVVSAPINLNFFAHTAPVADPVRMATWRERLRPYMEEFGVQVSENAAPGGRAPFDDAMCSLVEELRPEVVSFHFGLPAADLLARVKATGACILSSATTVAEARWLERQGCDAVIAQGYEAGGHRGSFLTDDMSAQPGTMALVPQVADAVSIPVIAAGGIGDGRGIRAALALGASAVQLGTVYLLTPEALTVAVHRAALRSAGDNSTAVTNVFTGRPARGVYNRLMTEVGPMSDLAPSFPLAGQPLAPLRAATEPKDIGDFQPLWAGQAATYAREIPALRLTEDLIKAALS
ncbi:nitronate monooxygenase [Luteibacter rhizovicinus]|uniref:Nitronate monooxygenase n=1 Tax=Luteibacter rhizovicinus TaxID=242606 RepID=A0A4R3YLA2_9GAMM|nr:nitronate monooxygenase family protein [Luteibacter rhizovicinus]TCV93347.1 nitronate monooxygenase [Luteibacter rhizovicinus]